MNLEINVFEAIAGAHRAILIGQSLSYAYSNGVAGEVDGLRFNVVCYGNKFERVSVKILGKKEPPITQEEIDRRNAAGDFVYCTFEGFKAKIYENFSDHSMRISATATDIQILPAATGKEVK